MIIIIVVIIIIVIIIIIIIIIMKHMTQQLVQQLWMQLKPFHFHSPASYSATAPIIIKINNQ